MRIFQQITTTNDANGHSRRLTAEYSTKTGAVLSVVKQYYSPAILSENDCLELAPVRVAPGEYRDYIKYAKASGRYIQ